METFSALLVTGEFPAQRPETRSFNVFCAWINGWVNNCEAGDLRPCPLWRHSIVILVLASTCWNNKGRSMGLLPDTWNCGLRMRRECRGRFPRPRLQRKPLVSDPGIHHGTCVTHVPWCMSGSLTCGGVENVPCIPVACATRKFTYLARGPWMTFSSLTASEGYQYNLLISVSIHTDVTTWVNLM